MRTSVGVGVDMNNTENSCGGNRVDEVKFALQKLIDDKEDSRGFTQEQRQLLSHLQLEELLKDGTGNGLPEDPSHKTVPSNATEKTSKEGTKECEAKEIDEVDEKGSERRKVRRQNVITHSLLSVLIAPTSAWQLSQVSS